MSWDSIPGGGRSGGLEGGGLGEGVPRAGEEREGLRVIGRLSSVSRLSRLCQTRDTALEGDNSRSVKK